MTWSKAARWALWGLIGIVVLMGLAWWAVPWVAQRQIEEHGTRVLGRAVTVERVSFSPWALSITLHRLAIAGAAGDTHPAPQFKVERVHVDAHLRSLWALAPVVEGIEVDAPVLRLAHLAPGRFDIDDVLQRLQPAGDAPSSTEPQRFALFNLVMRGGELAFDDRPVQRRHLLRSIDVAVPFLSNLPDDLAVKVEPHVSAIFGDRQFEVRGQVLPFAADRASELRLQLQGLELDPLWVYAPASLPIRLAGGVLTTDLQLRFSQPPGATPRLALSGRIGLDGLAIQTRGGDALLGWRRLALSLGDVQPLTRSVALESVELDGLSVDARRAGDGSLEWASLAQSGRQDAQAPAAPPTTPASAPLPSAQGAPAWQARLGRLSITDGALRWRDASTRPAVALDVVALDVQAESLQWPAAASSPLRASLALQQAGQAVARVQASGEISAVAANVAVEVSDAQLAVANPYLQPWLVPAIEGRMKVSARAEWATGDKPRLALSVPSLRLDGLSLREAAAGATGLSPTLAKATGRPAAVVPARLTALEVDDAQVDLLARQVQVGAVRLVKPELALSRPSGGDWNVLAWQASTSPQPASSTPSAGAVALSGAAAQADSPWRAQLKSLRVEGGRLQLNDAGAGEAVALTLREARLAVRDLAWPANAAGMPFDVAAQVLEPAADSGVQPGRAQAKGRLSLAPLGLSASVELERLPVHAVEPYFASLLPVALRRAEFGYRGNVDLRLAEPGLTLSARGDALVADLQVRTRASEAAGPASDELLSWQSLSLRPLRVALSPGRKPEIEVGELQLSDFYSRLVITEQGRFNLRDVQAPASTVAPVATASAASAAAAAAGDPGLPIDLVVGSTRLVNGRVDFTDRFIRPSYSAQLTELNGGIGRFSSTSRDMATLELKGRAAGTALLEVRGALNPTAAPLALDISARATDLELAPFSPYAGKYAGYAIERGKLSLDLAYRIDPDGKLEARNQLVLNQLTFGEQVQSPDATSLPVRLAVALLTDRNGVIDLDLPISGSINEPQFSIFGLVLKVIGNLIAKAVTAPFALLAGGGGEDLSLVEFLPGTTRIATGSTPVLERVAKALGNRPALRMTVTGAADPASERQAMQTAALEERLKVEQRRERARAGMANEAVLPDLGAADRERLIKRVYSETALPNKPKNLIGLSKDIPVGEMTALLQQAVPVNTDTARELALQRGLAVREALIARGLPAERLFLAAPRLRASTDDDAAWTPRVQLSLAAP